MGDEFLKRPPPAAPIRSPVHCVVDSFEDGLISGWAFDPTAESRPARFFVLVDGEQTNEVICRGPRPDVAKAGYAPEIVGFRAILPRRLLDGKQHHVEFRDMRRLSVIMRVNDNQADAFDFSAVWRPKIRSFVDGMRSGGFEGWVLQSDYETGQFQGNCIVKITCDGTTIGHTRANQVRADVGRSLSAPAHCGFRFVPPPAARRGRKQTYGFFLMPGDIELEQSPVVASLISDDSEARLLEVSDAIDRMHVELTRLRRQLRELLPKPVYPIENYDDWYPLYANALTRRVLADRKPGSATPLVSVICPVYRPTLDEFRAAVQSVIGQTYQNWELILVDDGSADEALTACIASFAAADARIKPRPMAKNGGISRSTNAGLQAASGEWVAFFDHDDMLADVALEVMVTAAHATGAKLLYSDEDKVDRFGRFVVPAFKPDWNHRLMLGVNYICHLLFVARPALDAVGPLNSKYDGAQDHDLILRLSEHLAPHEIRHVPEILYHWRITENSTASDTSAKPYAVSAGVSCVQDHLNRLGRSATVTAMKDSTIYHQKWNYSREPAVEIIIPFKDEIASTRRCVDTILTRTRYRNYRIRLVDNWSTSEEAFAFTAEMNKLPNVTVMRIEEPFNYSRLNNLAAEQSSAEFLMLMNNDLFVSDTTWLRVLVDEALADPTVAIVGGKFVYPTRNVQHAGVILGLGGVGSHVGMGLPEDEYGYSRRLLFAQEYAAVTAAAVLVRRHVFEAVGRLDETDLTIAFNDVDLCLKVRAAGYKVIYTPDFLAEHHESLSRGDDERPLQEARFFHENQVMKERWGDVLLTDPFYNKNFGLERGPFTELRPPEEAAMRDWVKLAQPPAPEVPKSMLVIEPPEPAPAAQPPAAPESRARRQKAAPKQPRTASANNLRGTGP
jgi:GT2 family glycosyltransferase